MDVLIGETIELEKKANGKVTAVFEIDLHCKGCAKKVENDVRGLDGFEGVMADWVANKLTVTGKEDLGVMKERLEAKTKKKVELIYPQPNKDSDEDKMPEENSKTEEEYEKPKESTVVLKIRLHCDGCVTKLEKIVRNFNGVEKVLNIAADKDLVTVKGTMDAKELAAYLKKKLKRNVEIVALNNDEDGDEKAYISGSDKKEKDDILCLIEDLALLYLQRKQYWY